MDFLRNCRPYAYQVLTYVKADGFSWDQDEAAWTMHIHSDGDVTLQQWPEICGDCVETQILLPEPEQIRDLDSISITVRSGVLMEYEEFSGNAVRSMIWSLAKNIMLDFRLEVEDDDGVQSTYTCLNVLRRAMQKRKKKNCAWK